MDTTVPAVKSLLVRARMSLAECTQSRLLTCGDVQLELAEAAEGLRKASGPVRQHVKRCDPCREYRSQLRSNGRALAALAPAGLVVLFHKLVGVKIGSGSAAGSTATAGGTGAASAGGAAGAGGAAAAGGGGLLGGAAAAAGGATAGLGAKAAAGVATAALLTAGAVEVKHIYSGDQPAESPAAAAHSAPAHVGPGGAAGHGHSNHRAQQQSFAYKDSATEEVATPAPTVDESAAGTAPDAVVGPTEDGVGSSGTDPAATGSGSGGGLLVATVPPPADPPTDPTTPPADPDPTYPPTDPPSDPPAEPTPTDPPADPPTDPPADPAP
jgi:hypothetical protein